MHTDARVLTNQLTQFRVSQFHPTHSSSVCSGVSRSKLCVNAAGLYSIRSNHLFFTMHRRTFMPGHFGRAPGHADWRRRQEAGQCTQG
jgi:hypothetical protein